MPAPATIFEIRKKSNFQKNIDFSKMPTISRCWDPERDGPSGGRIPAAATIFAISENLNYKKNERKIHISSAPVPNRDGPGAGQIPATATFFDHFLSRFGNSSSARVHHHSRRLRTSQLSPEGLSGVRRP